MADDVLTRNGDGELAVRTVQSTGDNYVNPNDVYTRDNDGNLCVRTTGGGDSHNKGYFATPEALRTAYPTAEAGDFAIVESTDTVWIWDSDTNAWKDSDQKGQVTSVNNQTGDVTVQETLISGTNIKSVNGNSLLGSGDLEIPTYDNYPAGWTTNLTTKDFCDDVAGDNSAVKGKAYLGEATFSDFPAGISNAEIEVKIMDGTTAQNKVIVLSLTSGNVAPYAWIYTYWNGGSSVSGWQALGSSVSSVNSQTGAVVLDAEDVGAVPQYTTMPTASASNLGEIAQYAGVEVPDVPTSATITETVGSGLTDLAVDVATFESVEQPSGNESVDFYATYNETDGFSWANLNKFEVTNYSDATATITDGVAFRSFLDTNYNNNWAKDYTGLFVYLPTQEGGWLFNNSAGDGGVFVVQELPSCITVTGEVQEGDSFDFVAEFIGANLSTYGITYSGTPNTPIDPEDPSSPYYTVIRVNYVKGTQGWGNGYFYKCVSDGQQPATYSWTRIDVQPQPVIPDPLPSQTGNNGKFLSTNGTTASWETISALQNTATGTNALTILGTATNGIDNVNIGPYSAINSGTDSTAVGCATVIAGNYAVACGHASEVSSDGGIAIGDHAYVAADYAIQLGGNPYSTRTNSDANTFKVGNNNGNFEMMDANGKIPADRLTKVNSTITLTSAGWSSNTQTVNVTGMTATGVVFVSPIPADQADYTTAGIICSAQGAGTLTFTCDTAPSGDIDVVVVML